MSSRRLVRKLHEFVKMQGRVEGTPGFSSALGLSHDLLLNSKESVTADESGVTLRYQVTVDRLLPKHDEISLSTYLAVIDDVTTWALVLGDEKRSRPGKSISLSLWAGPSTTINGRRPGDEVDIVTTVQKIGNNIGFCNAQVVDTASQELVCYASHIKYLSMGPLFDLALSSYGWKAAILYTDRFLSPPPADEPSLTDLFDSLTFVSDTAATFNVQPVHASLGGPVHGGCQAVLMEMVASQVAKQKLNCEKVALNSIQAEYMSPPRTKSGVIEIQTEVVSYNGTRGDIDMRVMMVGDGRIKSEGILSFSR